MRLTDPQLLERLHPLVVGRRRESEVVVAALGAGRHVLLEGPPGTGKSTLLAAVAATAGIGFAFVEGNAELTPARLVGHHDPSRVLAEGYTPEIFVDGPLATAMRDGQLLYVEELNRVPEETLNVLVNVMSDGALQVPRLGRLEAADSFRLVAALNPFDSVGTARISSAIYDRTCRVSMDYQTAEEELAVVCRRTGAPRPVGTLDRGVRRAAAWDPLPADASEVDPAWVRHVVDVVRRTRDHPEVRVGSSVRGAIDLVLVAAHLARLRGVDPGDPDVGVDAALAALSGRIQLHPGAGRSPEDIVTELWREVFDVDAARARGAEGAGGEQPDAPGPSASSPGDRLDHGGKDCAPGGPRPTGAGYSGGMLLAEP